MNKSDAIKEFLSRYTHKDLADLYNINMECQVNVAQGSGERVNGEYKGKKWHGYSDGINTWKPFRIPWNAATEAEYEDSPIKFSMEEHVEAIGMTGWDWKNKLSRWVAFDFDAITGHSDKHSKKLSPEELTDLQEQASKIPWVTIRKSAGGRGVHLYIFITPTPTSNHNEHAALARAILGIMSAITGFDFQSKVDICGGNMWVWHRKIKGSDGLTLIKQGDVLKNIPTNWKDHVKVVTGAKKRAIPSEILEIPKVSDPDAIFEELVGQRPKIPLDDEHKKLITFLQENNSQWWWDQDQHMLVTHTYDLKLAHTKLNMKGPYNTIAQGTEQGRDHNCFLFPIRKGAWVVRRFSQGVQEADNWDQDGAGWTRCYLNRDPDLRTATRAYNGIEDTDGSFVFRTADDALNASNAVGVNITLPNWIKSRRTKLKQHKDGRLIITLDHDPNDIADEMRGWLADKGKWKRIFNAQLTDPSEPEIANYDDFLRHLVSHSGEDAGWAFKTGDLWRDEPLNHLKLALKSIGHNSKDVEIISGSCVTKPWRVVNFPFQPEYPGDRCWNRKAAQLRFPLLPDKENLKYDSWMSILKHCGASLDTAIKTNVWCKSNGIANGADYLKCWIASVFQYPTEPLPYLFFYGPQNSGKSIFHEALELLLTRGYCRADTAITSQGNFNAELEHCILAIIEETNLSKNKLAYGRIKDWVTARQISVHQKGSTPYLITNTTHWIQCSNEHDACPIIPGDTRIIMIYVDDLPITKRIPKKALLNKLELEASAFLTEIMSLELPPPIDRLNIPVIITEDKILTEHLNRTRLQQFLADNTYAVPGECIKISEFYSRYTEWLEPNEIHHWTKIRVGKEMPPTIPKGRIFIREDKTNDWYYGNLSWISIEQTKPKFISVDGRLVHDAENKL